MVVDGIGVADDLEAGDYMNVVICPLSVQISKKKKFILNLNRYRSAHYQVLNKAKKAYFTAVKDQVLKLPGWKKVKVIFTVFPKDMRKFDLPNVSSVHSKFLLDVLVSLNKLPDDDFKHVVGTSDCFGYVDKLKPRVEARFIDMDE